MTPTLDRQRARIRELDEQILRLVAERMEAARAVGTEKRDRGVPLRDWDVERAVLERGDALASQIGLRPTLARSILRTLIRESRAEQEWHSFSASRGAAETIAVIGGAGRMGRWLADFLGNQGHRVRVHDPRASESEGDGSGRMCPARSGGDTDGPTSDACPQSLAAAIDGAAFVAIATPLGITPQVIDEIASLGCDAVVFDIASLKSHLRPAIDRARDAGIAITSLHPMFGPGTRTLADKVICVCDCGDADATRRAESLFADTAAARVHISLEEHDRVASLVLGLSHLINVVFSRALLGSGLSFDLLERVGSTTFQSQMTTTSTVIQEDPGLYFAIQRLNPFSQELYACLRAAIDEVDSAVRQQDEGAFAQIMHDARKWMFGR